MGRKQTDKRGLAHAAVNRSTAINENVWREKYPAGPITHVSVEDYLKEKEKEEENEENT